jgi:hypothetical protein
MPVTARLSKLFYDRLGEQIANERVDWFNAVDATYRSDLRDLNELNFARFDAKLEQRLAEFEAKLERKLERRLAEFRTELMAMFEQRFAALDARLSKVEIDIQVLRSELRGDLKALEARLVKWMFLFWAGTALAGLLLR